MRTHASSLSARVGLALVLLFGGCTGNESSSSSESPAKSTPSEPGGTPDTPKPQYPPAEQLLARHVEVSGGVDKIAQFETFYAESSLDTGNQKLRGSSKLWWKGGKFLVEEVIEGVGVSYIGYDGTTLWLNDPVNGQRKLEGREKASYVQSSSPMFPAHEWQKFYSKAETLGQVEAEGKKVWEVLLTSKEGPDTTIGLDVDDGHILYMKSKHVSPMGETPFVLYSRDYRPVLGYDFAYENRASISGLLEITTLTTKLEPNIPIDDAKFAYPAEHPVVPADPAAQPPIIAPPSGSPSEPPKP